MTQRRASAYLHGAPYDWPLKWQYALALGLVGASLLARWLLGGELAGHIAFLLLFCTLLPLALLVRPRPFLAAAVLGFLSSWLIFLPPQMSAEIPDGREGLLLAVFGLALGATALTAWLSRRALRLRQQDQRALVESARRLQLVLDTAPALISYLGADLRYRMHNESYELWFGSKGRNLEGTHMRDLLGNEAFERLRPYADTALSGKRVDFEGAIPLKDGSNRFVEAHYVPDVRADGVVAGFYAMLTDVSRYKQIEDELRLRSKQFETLVNAAPLGIYLVDADFRILQVNPIAWPIFGTASGDIIGRDLTEVVREMWAPDRAGDILHTLRHTLQTGEPYHEHEFAGLRSDSGVTEFYDWRTERIVLPDGRAGVVCYFRNVSAQIQARQAIAESEARYRTLFESIDEGFCILQLIFDEADQPIDCRYVEVNPAFEKQTGMKNALGRTIRELVPDIEPFWLDKYGKVALTGEPVHFVEHARSMGRWFDVDAFRIGEPEQRRVAVLFVDVTARKENEEALRESEERFRSMADSAPVLIWVSNIDGERTYFNLQWLRFTGRTPEEELHNGWLRGVHPDDFERCLAVLREAVEAREKFRVEYRLRRHDGEYRWLVDDGVPRLVPGVMFAGFIGSCIDITERKQSEETLREIDRRKDEFLATLAHELRNPLAAISTATSVLTDASDNAARVRKMAAIIERQSLQLVRLINDLLDVSRISRGKVKLERKRIDVSEIIRHAVADSRTMCEEKGLRLDAVLPEQPVIADADPIRLSQVVNNLIENACKFTPREGEVRVTAEHENGEVVIHIADTGIGMPQEQLSRIFEMFTQVEEWPSHRVGGLGIGLSLTKSIIELHGGRIEATSEGAGKGSEFRVRLPVGGIDASDGENSRESDVAKPVKRQMTERIVVADDNLDTLQAMSLLLRIKGHEVETAADGAEALRKVREYRPDIALLDIGMPEMDGYEVVQSIRQEPWGKDILLIAMTGWGQRRDKQKSREAGFDVHLTKPVDARTLDRLFAARRRTAPQI